MSTEYFYILTVRWVDPVTRTVGHVGCQHKIMLDPRLTADEKYTACLMDLVRRFSSSINVPVDLVSPMCWSLECNEPEPPLMAVQGEVDVTAIRRQAGQEISEIFHDYIHEHGKAWGPETRAVARVFVQLAERYTS